MGFLITLKNKFRSKNGLPLYGENDAVEIEPEDIAFYFPELEIDVSDPGSKEYVFLRNRIDEAYVFLPCEIYEKDSREYILALMYRVASDYTQNFTKEDASGGTSSGSSQNPQGLVITQETVKDVSVTYAQPTQQVGSAISTNLYANDFYGRKYIEFLSILKPIITSYWEKDSMCGEENES